LALNAADIEKAPARAQARIEAEQIDERTLRSIAGWLRVLARHYSARRSRKLEAMAAFVEQHNERVAARGSKSALDRQLTER
jgi:hypothetical protein